MKHPLHTILAILLWFGLLLCGQTRAAEGTRENLSLDSGWLFHPGDIPFPVIKGHGPSYDSAKAGKAWGAAAPDYDDGNWRELNLPHDWVVEGPFDPNANLSQGYRPRGVAWYRRHFKVPEGDRGRHLELQFDGVATHCTVWVNGLLAHRNWCGYTSFYTDITPFARFGDSVNTIAVRVDADAMEGWWYEGGGIYRHTWLLKRDLVHIATDGIYANPVKQPDGKWVVPVEITLNSCARAEESVQVETVLNDPQGKEAARGSAAVTVAPLADATAKLLLPVASPQLWSVAEPKLYELRALLRQPGKAGDSASVSCGFRTLRFDPDRGFFLNEQPLKLQGVCNHQDHAGVGVAVPDSIWEFRARRLKEMGVNACRSSHNPPAKEWLDVCDRLGLLVMDENRNFNSTPEYLRQLEWMVRRDRNHPSVILWSVFNEEPMQGSAQGYEMVRRMSAVVKRLDTSRPVTAAMNGGQFEPVSVAQAVDVVGFNYSVPGYDRFHKLNPTLPMTSSEDTSAFMTRGEYVNDSQRHLVASYDEEHAPWGWTHRGAWKDIATRPFIAGGFVWTGFDYRGEPTPHGWPSVSSFFGCLDLCGFPKAAFYMHQAHWVERPILQLIPHWNWPGREGKPIKVMAIANCDTVALFLNGKSLGDKPVDRFEFVEWQVPYAPGRLEAVGLKSGREVSRCVVETTGPAAALELAPERAQLAGDGWDAEPVTVRVVDEQGRLVPTASLKVDFELAGPGTILGLGNGDPNCHEPEKGRRHSTFNGLGQVVVQSQPGGSGALRLIARAEGIKPAATSILLQSIAARPEVAVIRPPMFLREWRMSPTAMTAPEPNQQIADNDMNSWSPVEAGKLQAFAGGKFAVFRTRFEPSAAVRAKGGRLGFDQLSGKAEIWLDGKLLVRKKDGAPGPLTVEIPSGEGSHTLNVLVEASGEKAGLGGRVTVENL